MRVDEQEVSSKPSDVMFLGQTNPRTERRDKATISFFETYFDVTGPHVWWYDGGSVSSGFLLSARFDAVVPLCCICPFFGRESYESVARSCCSYFSCRVWMGLWF